MFPQKSSKALVGFFVSFFFSPYTGKKECPFLTFCLGSPFKFKAIFFFYFIQQRK